MQAILEMLGSVGFNWRGTCQFCELSDYSLPS